MAEEPKNSGRPLADVPPGQRVRITGYEGGRMLRARLMAMGLGLGQMAVVLQNNRGLIILSVHGGRVALGRGVSQKILITPVAELPA